MGNSEKSEQRRGSFIMQSRGPEVDELLKDPNAFVLLTQIARRARRTNSFNVDGLKPGEALIGDYQSIGLTEQKYRSAKKRLEQYKLATFKPTNKGTIATLTNSDIYDINLSDGNDQTNRRATISQRSGNDPITTNNNDKNVNNAKNEREMALSLANRLSELINKAYPENPSISRDEINRWTDPIDQMISEGWQPHQIETTLRTLFTDSFEPCLFWRPKINSGADLQRNFTKIVKDLKEAQNRKQPGTDPGRQKTKGDKAVEFLTRNIT